MITIKHHRATFTVKPENAQQTHDLLALIDKTKGKKGTKLPRPKATRREHNSNLRSYPVMYLNTTTAGYVARYASMNGHVMLKPVGYTHADRIAPKLDFSEPEVVQCDE